MKFNINKQREGASLKLNVSVTMTGEDAEYSTQTCYNLDVVYLKLECSNGELGCYIKVWPFSEAKKNPIKVKVQCSRSYNEWIYTEDEQYKLVSRLAPPSRLLSKYYELKGMHVGELKLCITVIKACPLMANKLYNDKEFTDFHLSSSEGSVPIHRACLAAGSDVFKGMLSREWKETKEGRIQMEGVTLQTLQHLKQYLYLGVLPDDGLQSLLLLGSYYLMEDLKAECVTKLAMTVKPEELYSLFKFAFENELPQLTFAIISGTSEEVIEDAKNLYLKKNVKEDNNKV